MKHSTDVVEACESITATNHRVAPNLLHKQVIVNESVALNFISKVTNSSDFNNEIVLTTFDLTFEVVQDKIMKSPLFLFNYYQVLFSFDSTKRYN